VILVQQLNGWISVSCSSTRFPASQAKGIAIEALEGNDQIYLNSEEIAGRQPLAVTAVANGGAGDDRIVGSASKDLLIDGTGNDTVFGE
jgi:Ca2+-binding RTX toxin-like protein